MKLPPAVQTALFPVFTLAAYLVGVVPAEGSLGDVSTLQWLGAVVFLGVAYGIGSIPDQTVLARMDKAGAVTAGPASTVPTGAALRPDATVDYLTTKES